MRLRHLIRWTPVFGMVVALVTISNALSSPSGGSKAPSFGVANQQIQPKPSHSVGHVGCSAASCHGGGNIGEAGSESLTWFESDPHRKAFDVLHNAQSKTIAKNLAGEKGTVIPAHKDDRCLKCHAPETITAPGQHLLTPIGVGCESCHGPSGDWGTAHYQTSWKTLPAKQQASEYGFYPLKDLNFRVKVCASCHVGDENRDVNHDLIAAGHPRLAFEYTAYHHHPTYRKHWKERDPAFETKAWEAGQVVGAQSAVALLKARADRAGSKDNPWPELSEYACFSCHKELTPKVAGQTWKVNSADSIHRLGGMRWGSWYNATLPWLSENRGETVRELKIKSDLTELTKLLESPNHEPKKVSELAGRLIASFDRWNALRESPDAKPLSPAELSAGLLANALTGKDQKLRDMEWDEAAQHYLGLAAARFATRTKTNDHDPLLELRKQLKFPVTEKGRIDSPRETDPSKVRKIFKDLQHSPSREQRP